MEITERQWRNLSVKLDNIMSELNRVQNRVKTIEQRTQKRGLSFEESIPPHSICFEVLHSEGLNLLENQMKILSDYYGINTMGNFNCDAKVPSGAIACYHPSESNAYYKKGGWGMDVTLHEFFHHLVAQGVVHLNKGQHEEHWANKYAEIVMLRGK
ncbi:MAG: hypothetical protein NWF06_01860 [Candidatus Bathyarchaeota archaeon]|nr:hypothetical protein [Candidatus Bathyarchaeum sp.]